MPVDSIILPYKGVMPKLGADVFIAPGAVAIGDLEIGAGSSLWFGAIVRADVNVIRIGSNTNIQDGSVCHVTTEKWPLVIGNNVTVGHRAVLHGCTIGDGCLIGMGAIVLDGARVEPGAMVAAGAVVGPGKVVKTGELWAGLPAKLMRPLTQDEKDYLNWSAPHYYRLAQNYLKSGE